MAYLSRGYLYVYNGHGRVREGGPVHYPVHRLVYEETHQVVLPAGSVIHHRNGDTLDNRPENLDLVSRQDHPTRHRRSVRGKTRRCGCCMRWKPLSEFGKGQKRCKPCKRETHRAWVAANPDRIAIYNERRRRT